MDLLKKIFFFVYDNLDIYTPQTVKDVFDGLVVNKKKNNGLDACRRFLTSDTYTRNQLPVECILSLIRLVLENNHFQFNNDNYLQKLGTAMGSTMAPAYASLFMGKLEQDFLKSRSLAPSIWLRFLDDIFMVWDHSIESLHSFIDALNSFHPSIKFTYNISTKTVNFLDVTVSKSENLEFVTNVYVKSTNVHKYVEYSSCHHKSCKNGIPYSQGKRYRRIISNDKKFEESILQLRDFFLERNYPASIVDEALGNVSSLTQDEALQTAIKTGDKNFIPFVIEYNPSLPNICLVINKYWDLLQLSQSASVNSVHAYINLFWRLNDLRIYVITWYTRPSLMKLIIFLKHVTDVDALIVKILLKLTFLPVGALKRLSKCGFQQVARLRMSFI